MHDKYLKLCNGHLRDNLTWAFFFFFEIVLLARNFFKFYLTVCIFYTQKYLLSYHPLQTNEKNKYVGIQRKYVFQSQAICKNNVNEIISLKHKYIYLRNVFKDFQLIQRVFDCITAKELQRKFVINENYVFSYFN